MMRLLQYCISFFFFIGLVSCSSIQSTSKRPIDIDQSSIQIIDDEAKSRLTAVLSQYVEDKQVAGVSALVYEKNREVYFEALGYADREAGVPMDRNTLVKIYSMTKPITGVALMTLYEQGLFDLDDPVAKYAPEFADIQVMAGIDEQGEMILEDCIRPMTIRDLTRHTAGFAEPRDHNLEGIGPLMKALDPLNRNNTLAEMAQKLASVPLKYQPGTKWDYSISVDLQAYLVEVISGETYVDYVRANVLDKLGLDATRYFIPQEDRHLLSAIYQRDETGVINRMPDAEAHSDYFNRWPLTRGGSGLTSSIDDYMTFAQMLQNDGSYNGIQILKPETVKLMSTNHLDESIKDRSWLPHKGQVGFGIDFAVRLREPQSAEENNGIVGEFFWDGAASTLFWIDPVNELTVVMFVQIFPYDGIELHKSIRDAVYGAYDE